MKIVRENPFFFEFECRGCSSWLRAKADDVRVDTFFAMGGSSRHYYVTCQVCHTDHIIDSAILTPKVQAMADKKETS